MKENDQGRKVKLRHNYNHFKLSEYTSDVGPLLE